MSRIVCFDLEGPLSPQDNAFELMGLISRGHEVFSVISAYDDVLALECRQDYEPGDTLKLIIPFLLSHGVKNSDVKTVSDKAALIEGAGEVIEQLESDGWNVFIISTSYMQHALNIAGKVGASAQHVYCTKIDLDKMAADVSSEDLARVPELEEKILGLSGEPDRLNKILDEFYWSTLPATSLGEAMNRVSVCGGSRKVTSLLDAAGKTKTQLSNVVAVGDSITDYKMLGRVRDGGGLAVVFNGNKYALPYGNIGLAAKTMTPLLELTRAFSAGGLAAVKKLADSWDNDGEPYVHSLSGEPSKEILRAHAEMRSYCRGRAAELG